MSSSKLFSKLGHSQSIGSLFVGKNLKKGTVVPGEIKPAKFKRTLSRGTLKNQSSVKKRKKSRPNSAKSQGRKSRPGSGKRDTSMKSLNKSKSRDRSKASKYKESTISKKGSDKFSLKNLKSSQKHSSLKGLLNEIDGNQPHKARPPKAPSNSKITFKENIGINIQNMNIKRTRSRQRKLPDSKSGTTHSSPKLHTNLQFNKHPLKRKSSLVHLKKENDFTFTRKIGKIQRGGSKSILHKTHSSKGLKPFASVEKDLKSEESPSEFMY